jgi:hypothetical protein
MSRICQAGRNTTRSVNINAAGLFDVPDEVNLEAMAEEPLLTDCIAAPQEPAC